MHVQAKVFASLKQIVGAPAAALEVPEGCSVRELLLAFGKAFPRVREGIGAIRVAVNDEYATAEQTIEETDIIALIPPVSGGADVWDLGRSPATAAAD